MLIRAVVFALALATPISAQQVSDLEPRDGWHVSRSDKSFDQLVEATRAAAPAGKLAVVTMAGPTGAAANRGIDIPGNRVIGLFNNDFAVRILRLSTAAMIEAPIRMYVTENEDGTATLAYKLPSAVLGDYAQDAPDLVAIAAELDAAFAAVTAAALQ